MSTNVDEPVGVCFLPSPEKRKVATFGVILISNSICMYLTILFVGGLVQDVLGDDQHNSYQLSNIIFMNATLLFNFLVIGVTSRVGFAAGKGDEEVKRKFIRVAAYSAFVCGIVGTIALAVLQYPLFKLLAFSDAITSHAYSYYYISLIGMPFAICNMGLIGILQGLDRLWIIMISTFANYGVQLVANLLAVKVFHSLAASAVATLSGWIVGYAVSFSYIHRNHGRHFWPNIKQLRAQVVGDAADVYSVFKKDSLDLFINSICLVLWYMLPLAAAPRMNVPKGTIQYDQFEAMTIFWEAMLIASAFHVALGRLINIIGSKYHGEGRYVEFRTLCNSLEIIALLFGSMVAIICLAAKDWVISLLTTNEDVIKHLDPLWTMLSLSHPLQSLLAVSEGCLFACQAFGFIRNAYIYSFVAVFCPIFLLGVFHYESLEVIGVSAIAFIVARTVLFMWKLHWKIFPDCYHVQVLPDSELSLTSIPSVNIHEQYNLSFHGNIPASVTANLTDDDEEAVEYH
eukprot:TRINITY_DN3546_c0_g1_i1.p1 TRINITY_DN3546_c0_g1~~TRINITY_DN3546_c0_g1_i1.p1  ORF type:complete len:514 (-),score=82.36 TRINITY_DN3546_c0_g1_i1:80-1621(-)